MQICSSLLCNMFMGSLYISVSILNLLMHWNHSGFVLFKGCFDMFCLFSMIYVGVKCCAAIIAYPVVSLFLPECYFEFSRPSWPLALLTLLLL